MRNYNFNYKGRNNYRNNYKNNYRNGYGNGYHKPHYYQNQASHPEHPVRDAIYATLTCLGTLGFALLWWGIARGDVMPLVIGIISSAAAFITVSISLTRALLKLKQHNNYIKKKFFI